MSKGYVSIFYVRVGKHVFTPGEVIREEIDEEKAARLLRDGFIRPCDAPATKPEEPALDGEPVEADPVAEIPEEAPAEETPEEAPAEEIPEEAADEDDGDGDTAPIEIDDADAVIAPPKKKGRKSEAR